MRSVGKRICHEKHLARVSLNEQIGATLDDAILPNKTDVAAFVNQSITTSHNDPSITRAARYMPVVGPTTVLQELTGSCTHSPHTDPFGYKNSCCVKAAIETDRPPLPQVEEHNLTQLSANPISAISTYH